MNKTDKLTALLKEHDLESYLEGNDFVIKDEKGNIAKYDINEKDFYETPNYMLVANTRMWFLIRFDEQFMSGH